MTGERAASGAPRYVYRYVVTSSSLDTVPVGTRLVDKRRDLVKVWTVFQASTGDLVSFTGKREGRCCSDCHALGFVRDYGHDGDHGRDAPYTPSASEPSGASS